jgi:hypothetical protein
MPTTARPIASSPISRSADTAAPPRPQAEGPARRSNEAPPRPQAEGPARRSNEAPPRPQAEGPARRGNEAPPRPAAEGPARQSNNPVLVCVDPARVDAIWPHVRPLLSRAFRKRADDTLAAIEADVRAGDSLLWIVWGDALLAALTTRIMRTPTRKVLRIECCAGRAIARWIALIAELEDYGRREGCDVCRIEGRKGWRAMLRNYREPWIVLEKVL